MFRICHMLVVMKHMTRRIPHPTATTPPTAAWTLQYLPEAIAGNHGYPFLSHDSDSVIFQQLDQRVQQLGLRVLNTPVPNPTANPRRERLLGTLRRECLEFVIPLPENDL
jgi:hypothetical protein